MKEYFDDINPIQYEGPKTHHDLAYRYYDPKRLVLGKSMEDHLRLAVCCWHTFCWQGNDGFGDHTIMRPWLTSTNPKERMQAKIDAVFEFVSKLNIPFFTFHDRDIAPEGETLKNSNENLKYAADYIAKKMQKTGIKLLWGTANLFSHPRYMAGAATNPNPEVFAYALAQVKAAIDVTHSLNGANYVLWGGREGYETLLNTDLRQESQQLAKFLELLVEYKHKIGFKGLLLIEPKPCEPTKHQYDFDTGHVLAFLQKYHLEKEFKVNIEANHATLAGHSFAEEVAYACAYDIFGSIDANRGDPQLGWDTDQFPNELDVIAHTLYIILSHGGFNSGGFNFDAKVRRQSVDLKDLFYGHIGGIDMLARGLLVAARMIEEGKLKKFSQERYQSWSDGLGADILKNKYNLNQISNLVLDKGLNPKPVSGRQEYLENIFNGYLE